MPIDDITGWGSVALLTITFYLLHRFITSSPKVLEKILKDGFILGLCKIDKGTAEGKLLQSFLNPSKGSSNRRIKLGSIYKTNSFPGVVVMLTTIGFFLVLSAVSMIYNTIKWLWTVLRSRFTS